MFREQEQQFALLVQVRVFGGRNVDRQSAMLPDVETVGRARHERLRSRLVGYRPRQQSGKLVDVLLRADGADVAFQVVEQVGNF